MEEAENHLPSLPARANHEAELVPTPRYGRGRDLDVILEVIGSADRPPQ